MLHNSLPKDYTLHNDTNCTAQDSTVRLVLLQPRYLSYGDAIRNR